MLPKALADDHDSARAGVVRRGYFRCSLLVFVARFRVALRSVFKLPVPVPPFGVY